MKLVLLLVRLCTRILHGSERAINALRLRQLKTAGSGIVIGRGVKIEHPEYISLGANVHLNDHCWLSVVSTGDGKADPQLVIGAGSYIGRFGTLACIDRLVIGPNVLISDRVFIGDAAHGFARIDLPIMQQPMTSPGPVTIGGGTWIGIGVSILPNVHIGRNCVIGAGAVVSKDIPDYCVAVGNPARVIRCLADKT